MKNQEREVYLVPQMREKAKENFNEGRLNLQVVLKMVETDNKNFKYRDIEKTKQKCHGTAQVME